jgi:hypothetical protein
MCSGIVRGALRECLGGFPLFLVLGGTSPMPPGRGLRPLDPHCPPSWAEGSPAFWVPLGAGLLMWATRPLLMFCGGTPPTAPRHGGYAPQDPQFSHPRGLGVHQRFGSHSWRGVQRAANRHLIKSGDDPLEPSPLWKEGASI